MPIRDGIVGRPNTTALNNFDPIERVVSVQADAWRLVFGGDWFRGKPNGERR